MHTCSSIAGKCRLRLFGKGLNIILFYRKYLSHNHALSASFLSYWIDGRENRDAPFRVQGTQQQYIVAVNQDIVHGRLMLLPHWPVIEGCIDCGAGIDVVKTSDPGKTTRIVALEELTARECPQLLEGLGKKTLKILREMLALSLFDCVAAELNDLKVV